MKSRGKEPRCVESFVNMEENGSISMRMGETRSSLATRDGVAWNLSPMGLWTTQGAFSTESTM